MSQRKVIKDAGSGEFVSAEYAAENPDTTYVQPIAQPDAMDVDLAQIKELLQTRPIVEVVVLGERFSNTDPREAVRLAREYVERHMGESA